MTAHLSELLDHYERIAAAIRLTLDTITHEDTIHKLTAGHVPKLLSGALARDAQRRGPPSDDDEPVATPTKQGRRVKLSTSERRAKTAATLASMSTTTPVKRLFQGAGTLVREGYIARTRDGWVRTDKPFATKKPHAGATQHSDPASTRSRRATAKLLARMSATTPTPGRKIRGVGILAHRGYITKSGDGWVRTDKPFVVAA